MTFLNRRQFTAASVGAALSRPAAAAPPPYADEYPDMLAAYFAGKLDGLAKHWDSERAKITTAADVERRNRYVRGIFREMVHGFPARNPLNPVTAASFERPGYRVENVMFESRPNFLVTGNLYVPTMGTGPFPALISPCGHYGDARMNPEYQSAYLNLVKNGFVVLAYDPIGQGERRQYWNPHTGETEVGGPTTEHSMPGQLLLMMGEDLTHYRIWDGMRAIDYLLTRPEVDGARIGCAGHSGGGTLTLFISALDERVKCAVVNEGGTSHRWPIDVRPGATMGPADVEQNYFPGAKHGVDLCDLHVAIAPRPLLALIENFNPRFNEAAAHIRERYRQLGVEANFSTEEAADPHAWTPKLRLATTNWFCRWFQNRKGPAQEPDYEVEGVNRLFCTPLGSIREAGRGETIFTLIQKKAAALPPEGKADFARALRIAPRQGADLAVRFAGATARKGYRVEKLAFLSEPGIYIPTWVLVPDAPANGPRPVTLYVHERGKEADAMEFGPLEALARKGNLIVSVDVRGIGETRTPHLQRGGSGLFSHLFDPETAMAYYAWYMDESLLGMRVFDVIRAVDYTLSREDASKELRVHGKGMGALWVLFAAAIDPRIRTTVAEGGLVSYRTLAKSDRYLHGANIMVRDGLLEFDLPQAAAALAGRKLVLAAPVDAMRKRAPFSAVESEYASTRKAFAAAGGDFRIVESL
jgi:cephalosporin-C deacetylase-like acetyl esterase